MTELKDFVLIGEYDSFYRYDVVINGKSLPYQEREKIISKLINTRFSEFGSLFESLFPGKIVIYNCDGEYWCYKDGKLIDLS